MNNSKTRKLVLTSLFVAIVCVLTFIVKIPTPTKGYVNLGDCAVIAAGWFLGPVYGAAAGGIGSALTDIFSGYFVYAPATFIIKATMSAAAFFVYHIMSARANNLVSRITAGITAEIIMILGYFIYEGLIYGSFATAALGIPGNIAQGIMGVAGAVLIQETVLKRISAKIS